MFKINPIIKKQIPLYIPPVNGLLKLLPAKQLPKLNRITASNVNGYQIRALTGLD